MLFVNSNIIFLLNPGVSTSLVISNNNAKKHVFFVVGKQKKIMKETVLSLHKEKSYSTSSKQSF